MEKLRVNQMMVEVDQGVAYVQFEKKMNIRSHIQYIAYIWGLRKDITETSQKMGAGVVLNWS